MVMVARVFMYVFVALFCQAEVAIPPGTQEDPSTRRAAEGAFKKAAGKDGKKDCFLCSLERLVERGNA